MALDPTVVIQALREQLVELGLGPMPEHKRFAEYTKVHHNIYGESRARRNAWMPERPNDKAEVVYFVGCTPAYRNTNIALSTYKILKTLGVNFTILDDEWCCGRTLLYTGQRHQAFDVFRRNMEAIESTGASMVVTSCPGCYGMFKSKYPRLTRTKLPFEVVHITEFLSKFGSNLKLSKEIKIKATYHDPCHLGRAEGIYNEPRYLLENIPGVSFNEMERIGRSSWCCGAGGGVLAAFPKFAEFTASSRLREATEYADADALVTACPFCHFNLSRTAETLGSSIKIYDIVELIAKAIS
jgi:heterodisulfide reductase subunit D